MNQSRYDTAMSKQHWSARLVKAMAQRDMTAADLARAVGVEYDRIYKYTKGKGDHPRGDLLDRIARALGVTGTWLSHGVDPGVVSSQTGLRAIPLYTLAEASMPTKPAAQHYIQAPVDVGPRSMAVRVADRALIGDNIAEGDILIIDPDAAADPGRIVLAKAGGQPILRRLRQTKPKTLVGSILLAANPDYPEATMQRGDSVIGPAVLHIRKI